MLFLLSLGLAKDNQKLISIQAAPPLPRSQPETSVYFCQCICDFCLWGSVAVERDIIIIRYASPQLWFKYCFGKSHCVEHNGVSGGSTSTSISQCMLKVCVYTPHNLRDSLTWISRPYTLWYFGKLRTSLLISRKNSLFLCATKSHHTLFHLHFHYHFWQILKTFFGVQKTWHICKWSK